MPIKLDWSGWDFGGIVTQTDGNLALAPDDFKALPDEDESANSTPSGGDTSTGAVEPVEGKGLKLPETERKEAASTSPLLARKFNQMDKQTLVAVVSAFKESCRRCGVSYRVGQDEQERPRVVLSGKRGGLALLGLELRIEQEPQLEAALLLELAQKDADLRYILDERAAIRAADGLSDDDMTVALVMIGADERMAEIEAERAKFEATLSMI